ncbi:YqaA family protein [Pararhizobium haloflavum]|uniref:YqaA family protein n=1 Tax=Pararhizobium haloflavum TaxID=2037914 RepID=UPI000C183F23|nr:YqaA family protein [Pararhizobium haloflavum]
MDDLGAYGGLFLTAFVAATLVPAGSEAVLVGLLLTDRFDPLGLLTAASIGNVLGSCVNFLIGRFANELRDKRWFPVSERALDRASLWYGRYGKWTLLLSWLPVIGDPLTVVAGLLRTPFVTFLVLVTLAKATRYGLLMMATLNWS